MAQRQHAAADESGDDKLLEEVLKKLDKIYAEAKETNDIDELDDLVRFPPVTPVGLAGPRESRFKSKVPDQFLWGSQVVRRLAVNRFMRRFESCPHSQIPGSLSG